MMIDKLFQTLDSGDLECLKMGCIPKQIRWMGFRGIMCSIKPMFFLANAMSQVCFNMEDIHSVKGRFPRENDDSAKDLWISNF